MTNARFCIIPARALGDKRLNRTDIMVLNALGMFGDKQGWSFPSTSTIAEMIQAHRVSVSKALSSLVECGYIECRTRYRQDGGQTSNEYRILFDAPSVQGSLDLDMPAAPDYDDQPPVADSLPPCSETATPPVAAGTTPPVAEPLHRNDPTLTPQVNAAADGARGGALVQQEKAIPDFAAVYQRATEIIAAPVPYASAPVHAWLEGGAIPEVDIYPTIERMIAKRRDRPPSSLSYFTQAIADSIHQRTQPLPKGKTNANKPAHRKESAHDTAGRAWAQAAGIPAGS
jgi:hypothetical protein